jgi:class I fructose-bisphosphate aldolase
LYVGTPAQEADFEQYRHIRAQAQRLGMPLIVWAYPRGAAIEAKGGKDSFYAVDYAARTASELGADVVKVNFPHPEKRDGVKKEYDGDFSSQQAIDAVVRSANRTLVLVSGGSKAGDEAMIEKARQSMEAGATGLIFGRNVWQRPYDESLRFVDRLREVLAKYPTA